MPAFLFPQNAPVPLVWVHGTGANGDAMRSYLARNGGAVPGAFSLFPDFEIPYHFLLPNADARLIALLERHRQSGDCEGKIVLVGHSGGAQFAHRFALKHPHLVSGAVCLAAGCWTNPRGQSYGMMVEENWFNRAPWNSSAISQALTRDANGDVASVEWIVGCGDQDLAARRASARRFHRDVNAQTEFFEWSGGHQMPQAKDAEQLMQLVKGQVERASLRRLTV